MLREIIPLAGLFFWTKSSSAAWERRSIWPPLIPPTHSSSSSSSSSLFPGKWQLHIRKLENDPVAFLGLKRAYSLDTFHRSWHSSSHLHRTLNMMMVDAQRWWFGGALTSPLVSNITAVVTGVKSFCQLRIVANVSPFPVCGLCGRSTPLFKIAFLNSDHPAVHCRKIWRSENTSGLFLEALRNYICD